MNNIIYLSEHRDSFQKIEPLIMDICLSAGGSEAMAIEVIAEYKTYFEQLSALNSMGSYDEQLNHACHIILGLLIKEKLRVYQSR